MHLEPLTLTRPVHDLRVGLLTIREQWMRALGVRRATGPLRPHLRGLFPPPPKAAPAKLKPHHFQTSLSGQMRCQRESPVSVIRAKFNPCTAPRKNPVRGAGQCLIIQYGSTSNPGFKKFCNWAGAQSNPMRWCRRL